MNLCCTNTIFITSFHFFIVFYFFLNLTKLLSFHKGFQVLFGYWNSMFIFLSAFCHKMSSMSSNMEMEKVLSFPYELSRNSWSWLPIVGSNSNIESFGMTFFSMHFAKKILCNQYFALLSLSWLCSIAYFPLLLAYWIAGDSKLMLMSIGSPTNVDVVRSKWLIIFWS